MSDNDYVPCRKCGRVGRRRDMHKCPPLWEWRETLNYGEDEWLEVYASSPEHAAEKAAELYDQEDYSLVRYTGNSVVIMIRNPSTREVTLWSCTGESLPSYYARQLT